jgi:succinate dehydrogenase / fumarate reductase flavoprotein subunit
MVMTSSYDVVVVGAGGAGLRATLGMAEQGLKTACMCPRCSRPARTRWRRRAASPRALGNMGPDTGTGTCTTP